MSEVVHLEIDGPVATITLDSPANRNALSRQLITELGQHLEAAEANSDVRAVVLAHTGTVFCSGADLSEAAEGSMEDGAKAIVELQRYIVTMSKPLVTKLAGAVRAGGTGLVAASDIVYCTERTNFALTEVKLGLTPAVISLTVLPRLTSRAAAWTFLTGAKFGGEYAAEIGLVTACLAEDELDGHVANAAAEIATGSAQGLRETKALVNADLLANIDAGGDDMASLSARLFGSAEAKEAMTAFLSKK